MPYIWDIEQTIYAAIVVVAFSTPYILQLNILSAYILFGNFIAPSVCMSLCHFLKLAITHYVMRWEMIIATSFGGYNTINSPRQLNIYTHAIHVLVVESVIFIQLINHCIKTRRHNTYVVSEYQTGINLNHESREHWGKNKAFFNKFS